MTPERWQQVDKLLEQALEHEPARRGAFLDEACRGDDELRQEVSSLLSAHGKAEGFTEAGPMHKPARVASLEEAQLLTGRQVGHYQILSRLGEGGMGIVYKAHDQQLDRHVAIKVLPPELVADPDRKRRFVQEAKAASALNHPNIITIHEIASDHGMDFIVMEYVAGKTLDQLIPRKGIQVNEALKIAIPIADALVTAHAAGIVHRDLKPGNLMIGDNGLVKVLDFGLAKLIHSENNQTLDTRTLQQNNAPRTDAGLILGTVSYMSPEQAEGKPVDARSDIFSLGSVLYEMVTGQRAFHGDSTLSTRMAILRDDPPPVCSVQKKAPLELERIVAKALEKDREMRCQTALDLRADLKRLQRDADSREPVGTGVQEATASADSRRRLMPLAGALTLLLVAVGVGWYLWRREGPRLELTQRQLTTNSSEAPVTAAAMSPDGRSLAFADENGVYLRLIDTGERHSLSVPTMKISHLAWLPDGTKLLASGVGAEGNAPSLWSLSVFGGIPRKLRDNTLNASVSPDGTQIAFVSAKGNEIWVMRANGEEAAKIVSGSKEDHFLRLLWFPHGRRIGYIREVVRKQKLEIETYDLRGGSATTLFSGSWLSDMLLSDGRILYSIAEQLNRVQSSLWEIPTNMETGQAIGKPALILTWPGFSVRSLSASQDGKHMAFLKETSQAEIYVGKLVENGRQMNVPTRLTFDDRYDGPAAWTPDSKAVIFSSDRNGNFDIFKQTLGTRWAEPMVEGPAGELDPTVSPDGAWLLYFALPTRFRISSADPVSLKRSPVSGGPAEEVLHERGFTRVSCAHRSSNRCVIDQRTESQLRFCSFDPVHGKGQELARIEIEQSIRDYWWDLSPDGTQIVFTTAAEQGRIRILSLAKGASNEVQVIAPGWSEMGTGWSADGKGWFATGHKGGSEALLHIDRQGQASVLWQQQISTGGLWAIPSPDGRYLAFPASTSTSNAWMVENF